MCNLMVMTFYDNEVHMVHIPKIILAFNIVDVELVCM